MKKSHAIALAGLFVGLTGCSGLEFKTTGPNRSAPKTTSAIAGESADAKAVESPTAPKAAAEDTSGEEFKKLLEAAGENVGREAGDLGLKEGCVPKRNVVSGGAANAANAGLTGLLGTFRRGWGGGGGSPPPPPLKNTMIDASECVSEYIRTEPFALCQIKTASGQLAECARWSKIGGEDKKDSQKECQAKADALSGVRTNPIVEGSEPKKEFFFICQKL